MSLALSRCIPALIPILPASTNIQVDQCIAIDPSRFISVLSNGHGVPGCVLHGWTAGQLPEDTNFGVYVLDISDCSELFRGAEEVAQHDRELAPADRVCVSRFVFV